MRSVIYSMMVSLDGFVETPDHSLDWVYVDGELHRFINAQARQHEMFVNGRRLYQVLRVWDTITTDQPDLADYMVEFAEVWNTKPKLVISSKLQEVGRNARIIHTPDVDSELRLLNQQTDGELDIGGPMLAATAIRLASPSEGRCAPAKNLARVSRVQASTDVITSAARRPATIAVFPRSPSSASRPYAGRNMNSSFTITRFAPRMSSLPCEQDFAVATES